MFARDPSFWWVRGLRGPAIWGPMLVCYAYSPANRSDAPALARTHFMSIACVHYQSIIHACTSSSGSLKSIPMYVERRDLSVVLLLAQLLLARLLKIFLLPFLLFRDNVASGS